MTENFENFKFEKLEIIEKRHILYVFGQLCFNRTHTAKALGIGVRTLQRKLIQWGLQDLRYIKGGLS